MSFFAVYDRIVPAQNKYTACLWNGATGRKVVVNRIYRFNWQVAAVTGIQLEQYLTEITARAGTPTAVTIRAEDEVDVLTTGIVAEHNGTATEGGRGLLHRFFASSEEMALAATNLTKDTALLHDAQLVYWRRPGSKGLVLATGRGLAIKNVTSSTVGSVSYRFEFDDEPA